MNNVKLTAAVDLTYYVVRVAGRVVEEGKTNPDAWRALMDRLSEKYNCDAPNIVHWIF